MVEMVEKNFDKAYQFHRMSYVMEYRGEEPIGYHNI